MEFGQPALGHPRSSRGYSRRARFLTTVGAVVPFLKSMALGELA